MPENEDEMELCQIYRDRLRTEVLEKDSPVEEKSAIPKKKPEKKVEVKAELEFDYLREELFFGNKLDEIIALLDEENLGVITSSGSKTISDSKKNWVPNQWKGTSLKFLTGVLDGETYSVESNTENTISITGTFSAVPERGAAYKLYSPSTDSSAKQLGLYKDSKFNESVTANTDIFSTALSSSYASSTYISNFRIYAVFNASGVLSVRRTQNGTTIEEKLNSGNTLSADCTYVFDIVVEEGQTINLRYSNNATALILTVAEIGGGI